MCLVRRIIRGGAIKTAVRGPARRHVCHRVFTSFAPMKVSPAIHGLNGDMGRNLPCRASSVKSRISAGAKAGARQNPRFAQHGRRRRKYRTLCAVTSRRQSRLVGVKRHKSCRERKRQWRRLNSCVGHLTGKCAEAAHLNDRGVPVPIRYAQREILCFGASRHQEKSPSS